MDDKIIPHLVARFLSWKLPPDFCPDAGISFAPEYNVTYNAERGLPPNRHEPTGTNLLNAEQAFAMFRHVLDHPAVSGDVRTFPTSPLATRAADRLSEMEAENKRLREALADLTSWFTRPTFNGPIWTIPAGERGADDAVNAARAALEPQQKEPRS
jgi:hypothetical protein